ncbi:DUF2326 domain-containing protein [Arthrobacter sp. 754]|uniref:DUF2326 domain-containing protein n=1 Tax=Arthrobacter sp. 754 TaxID=3156315 RepID=UPI003398F9C8
MLKKLTANKDAFRPIFFREGLNVVLAEQAPDALSTDSRNARGKTTLFHIVRFMLGGNLPKQLAPLKDDGWEFSLTLELFNEDVTVTRRLGGGTGLGIYYSPELKTVMELYVSEGQISLESWKELLGLAFFSLDQDNTSGSFGLSARTLLSYVIRIDSGADPLKAFPLQPGWSARQHLAFMFGLDWRIIRDLQELGQKSAALSSITSAADQGLLPSFSGESDLLIERSEAQRQFHEFQTRANDFQILDDPQALIQQADRLTEALSRLRDEAFEDSRMMTLYGDALREAVQEAEDTLDADVSFLYEQAGTLLGENVRQRLSDVKAFHTRLAQNRKVFIEQSLSALVDVQQERKRQLDELTNERMELFRAINAGGAIDELLALKDQASTFQRRLSEIELRLQQVRDVTESQERLLAERSTHRQEAQTQLNRSRKKLDRIANRFDERMRRLYGVGGVLTAAVDNDGYKFAINVAGQNSTGVNKMKLFCLDLALLEEGVDSSHHPDFLIHDSSVFDGVDPRQTASALQLASETVSSVRAQYICALNSNDVHPEIRDAEWFSDGIVRTVLDTDTGGLLGVKF